MRNPHGCVTVFDGTNARGVSADTITCCHCGMVYEVPDKDQAPIDELGGRDPAPSFCTLCGDFYCPLCVGKACDPFEKKLDRIEKASVQRRAFDAALERNQ